MSFLLTRQAQVSTEEEFVLRHNHAFDTDGLSGVCHIPGLVEAVDAKVADLAPELALADRMARQHAAARRQKMSIWERCVDRLAGMSSWRRLKNDREMTVYFNAALRSTSREEWAPPAREALAARYPGLLHVVRLIMAHHVREFWLRQQRSAA